MQPTSLAAMSGGWAVTGQKTWVVRAGAQRLHGPRFLPRILHGGLALTAWGSQTPASHKRSQPKAVTRDASGMEARRVETASWVRSTTARPVGGRPKKESENSTMRCAATRLSALASIAKYERSSFVLTPLGRYCRLIVKGRDQSCFRGVETSHLTGKSVTVTNAPFDPHGPGGGGLYRLRG